MGGIVAADGVVNFDLSLQRETMETHAVDTATYHLLSTNMLCMAGYLSKFKNDNFKFYDMSGNKITRSCQAVLEGW